MNPNQNTQQWRYVSFAFLAAGWLVSAYLLLRMVTIGGIHLRLSPAIHAMSLCRACDDALGSSAAMAKGIPLPGVGLIYSAVIGFLLAFGGIWAVRLAFLICAAGMGASILLLSSLLSSEGAACTLCLLVHAANLGLLAALFAMVGRQLPRLVSSKAWALVAVVVIATSALLQAAIVRTDRDSGKLVAEYRTAPLYEIPPDSSDAVLGPANGRVRLVVFSSFQCPWCKTFAPEVHALNERFGDRLTIVFKHFPPGKECNPALKVDVQPRACSAALAAVAANRQNAFWQFHDSLFSDSLQDSEEMLTAAARSAGLNLPQWEEDRRSLATRVKVLSDAKLGMRLGIDGTPAVFLDGRRVKNPTLVVLETLIRKELEMAR
jgi:protein-disulfide isomerase